ncbi:DUF397 domain-containing protein [Yinghuangia aomiensis]
MASPQWRKSSYQRELGRTVRRSCRSIDSTVGVRDSKVTAGPELRFEAQNWGRFLNAATSRTRDSLWRPGPEVRNSGPRLPVRQ